LIIALKGYSEKHDKDKGEKLVTPFTDIKTAVRCKEGGTFALAKQHISSEIRDIKTEYCFYIDTKGPLFP